MQDSIKTTSAGDVEDKDIWVDPQLVEMMREALQRVDTLYKGEDLTYSYSYSDTLPISETIIKVGKLFDQQPYVVVNSTWEDRLIEVYKIEQNHTFRKKFSYISSWMEFARDSIFDVNGDGINDLSITWSGTGALNYNPTYIYLFDPKTATKPSPKVLREDQEQVLKQLADLDINQLTPLQALEGLAAMQDQLK